MSRSDALSSLTEFSRVCQKPNYKTQGNWMVRTFLRDWAVPCSWLLFQINISANQVTAFSIAVALIAAGLISHPSALVFGIGTVLLQVWYYLDHVDGQLARAYGTASLTGRFFDFVMHHIVHGAVSFCCGLYLFWFFDSVIFIYLSGLATVMMMGFNLIFDAKYKTYIEFLQKEPGFTSVVSVLSEKKQKRVSQSALRFLFSFLHKANEIHVMMNVLTGVALIGVVFDAVFLRVGAAFFYLITPVIIMPGKLWHVVRFGEIDREFNRFFTRS